MFRSVMFIALIMVKLNKITLEIMWTLGQTDLPLKIEKDKNTDNNEENNRDNREFFEIFGIRLYFDDILILCLLYFLYKEDVHDEMLFFALILLLIT